MKNNALFNNLKHHPNRIFINIVTLLILLIAGGLIIAGFSQKQEIRKRASGTGRVDISMIPPTETITNGASSTFGLTMNTNGANVVKTNIHLKFDPAQVQISFTKGTALPKVTQAFTITGATAEVTLAANSPASPFKGNAGNLGSLTVKQIGNGNSKIEFNQSTTSVATVPDTGNAAGSLTGSAITVRVTPANVDLNFNPATDTLVKNQQRTFALNINTNGGQVSSAAIDLTYDPTAITINQFATTSASALPWLAARLAKPAANRVTITLSSRPGIRFSGSGILGNLTITQTGTKSSIISFNSGTIVKQNGHPGNALGTSGKISITYPPAPTSIPTRTPTPTPTPPGKTAVFLIKLDGVAAAQAAGAKMSVWFQKNGLSTQRTEIPIMTLTHTGNGVYKGSAAIPSSFPAGTKFNVLVRGAKHLITPFTLLTGQAVRCNAGQLITMPNPVPVTMTFNFTGVPLPAGDTISQDNIVDFKDIKRIEDLLNKASTALTPADKNVGDLNYDGKISFIDLGLIYKTILVACPQY